MLKGKHSLTLTQANRFSSAILLKLCTKRPRRHSKNLCFQLPFLCGALSLSHRAPSRQSEITRGYSIVICFQVASAEVCLKCDILAAWSRKIAGCSLDFCLWKSDRKQWKNEVAVEAFSFIFSASPSTNIGISMSIAKYVSGLKNCLHYVGDLTLQKNSDSEAWGSTVMERINLFRGFQERSVSSFDS